MALTWPNKGDDEVLDYGIPWTDLLAGDTIVSSTFAVISGDVVIDSSAFTTTTTTVWLSGGTDGTSCVLNNTITTAAGRTFEQAVKIKIKAR